MTNSDDKPTGLDANGVLSKEEEMRFIAVINEFDTSDKDKLKQAIDKIINVRLHNNLLINQGIAVGILSDNISIENAQGLEKQNKDGVTELIKASQLLDGNQDFGEGNVGNIFTIIQQIQRDFSESSKPSTLLDKGNGLHER